MSDEISAKVFVATHLAAALCQKNVSVGNIIKDPSESLAKQAVAIYKAVFKELAEDKKG